MSLVGIDIGSSSVKVAAYSEGGKLLALTSGNLTPIHPAPGLWETDPIDIWQTTSQAMRALMAQHAVRRDPPQAIAVSASGRENFLADAAGNPLTNGIMGADVRGDEFEVVPQEESVPEPWCFSCGHARERMDPVFRLAWWSKYHPEVVEQASFYFGWIDYMTFRMTGRAAMDPSTASRYAVYDLTSHDWAQVRVESDLIDERFLPEVLPWGSLVGELSPDVAAEWDLPAGVLVAQGCHDVNCAAYGAGASDVGVACLISGSYENILVPTDKLPTTTMLLKGLSVMPHPGAAGLSVLAVHPTGNAVLNWGRSLTHTSIGDVERVLREHDGFPSPVMAVPYLSGSMAYWEDGRKARGCILGLTLATSNTDIVQAFMESIVYDTVNSLLLMRSEGIDIERIKITGGGARSAWWSQLKADLTNVPIETVEHPEPGTLGAALLAGVALGLYDNIETAIAPHAHSQTVYRPNPERAKRHEVRLKEYNELMKLLLTHIF